MADMEAFLEVSFRPHRGYIYIYIFIISLIIHEEKTKEISDMTVVVYLIQNSADLHKL